MNTITVNFVECSPAPTNGYNVQWRVAGTGDPFTDAGNFTTSPAIFTDNVNPFGTQYEGKIRSDNTESGESGSNFCNDIFWQTQGEESGGGGLGIAVEARYNNSLPAHCALPGNTVYTDDGTIATGKTVYQDSAMSVLLDGFDLISTVSSGMLFNMNSLTAVVGSPTGDTC